eukprot:TRINITY_DN37293_c1_g1_i1.p1 TRINITY_DN37293_c1_g1~~TRINITY_DN37293_c1_g1_i1.p1  ORF type:complete len:464 (-),score=93.57 TRINITY_DN37293_c1_g1_i1:53-1444(-)
MSWSSSVAARVKNASFSQVLILAFLIRAVLIFYGIWHDEHYVVKYTDIDYVVFTDASRFMSQGKSPYSRATYRYTPLLAEVLLPNIWVHHTFGKWLFCLADLVVGWLLHRMLTDRGVSGRKATLYSALYLLSPLSFNVSSRGNAEAIVSFSVLITLFLLSKKKVVLAALCFGFSVHLKLYPIIYSLSLFLFLDEEDFEGKKIQSRSDHISRKKKEKGSASMVRGVMKNVISNVRFLFSSAFWTKTRLVFTVISAMTFILLTGFYYLRFGWEFLFETYLYHFIRQDPRHNFSVYFYQMYLFSSLAATSTQTAAGFVLTLSKFAAFVPQLLLIVTTSLRFRKDPYFSVFLLTHIFVTFNKVCTVQYFLWYLSILPLILPFSRIRLWKAISMISIFAATQGLWLWFAYQLEFLGENTFFSIWVAGVVFFVGNIWIAAEICRNHQSEPLFARGKINRFVDEKERKHQ